MKKRRHTAPPTRGSAHPSPSSLRSRQLRDEWEAALQAVLQREKEEEFKFSLHDPWSVQLFLALAKKFGLEPYRTHGQKSQTVMVRAPKSVVENHLWPEFNRLGARLHAALQKATDELIQETLGSSQ